MKMQTLQTICKQHDILYLGLFGSYARNEARTDSDVDILVDFKKTKSLFELARIKKALEKMFDRKVDLVLKQSLKQKLIPYVYHDLKPVYEENK